MNPLSSQEEEFLLARKKNIDTYSRTLHDLCSALQHIDKADPFKVVILNVVEQLLEEMLLYKYNEDDLSEVEQVIFKKLLIQITSTESRISNLNTLLAVAMEALDAYISDKRMESLITKQATKEDIVVYQRGQHEV